MKFNETPSSHRSLLCWTAIMFLLSLFGNGTIAKAAKDPNSMAVTTYRFESAESLIVTANALNLKVIGSSTSNILGTLESPRHGRPVMVAPRVVGDGLYINVRDTSARKRKALSFLILRVPRNIKLSIKLQVGNLAISDVQTATANVGVGDISFYKIRQNIIGLTSMGRVEANLSRNWEGSTVRLESKMGDVTLHVPSHFAAHYDLRTKMGSAYAPKSTPGNNPLISLQSLMGNLRVIQ